MTGLKESALRTLVPIVYALLLKWGAGGLGIDDGLIQSAAAAIVTAGIYLAIRVLERARSSRWGWLLGYPSAPVYSGQRSE